MKWYHWLLGAGVVYFLFRNKEEVISSAPGMMPSFAPKAVPLNPVTVGWPADAYQKLALYFAQLYGKNCTDLIKTADDLTKYNCCDPTTGSIKIVTNDDGSIYVFCWHTLKDKDGRTIQKPSEKPLAVFSSPEALYASIDPLSQSVIFGY